MRFAKDTREMVMEILKEKDPMRQQMFFGFYRAKLSPDQKRFIKSKLSPILHYSRKRIGGNLTTWLDDVEDKKYQDILFH